MRCLRDGVQASLRDAEGLDAFPWVETHGYHHEVATRLGVKVDYDGEFEKWWVLSGFHLTKATFRVINIVIVRKSSEICREVARF